MNWAITLVIDEDQSIDLRLKTVIFYILHNYNITNFLLNDIDATGSVGDRLTKMINAHGRNLAIEKKDILELMSDDGQIIELDLHFEGSSRYRFIVRDGYWVIITGTGERLPKSTTGDFDETDVSLYE